MIIGVCLGSSGRVLAWAASGPASLPASCASCQFG